MLPLFRILAVRAGCAALVVFATVAPLRAGSADVESIFLVKLVDYLQLGPDQSDIFFTKTPYVLGAIVTASSAGSVLGGSFSPPGGQPIALKPSDPTSFQFLQRFETPTEAAALFPDGVYSFSIDTATPQSPFTATIPFAQRFPPVPQLLNSEWYSVLIQFDTRKDFTFSWSGFPGFSFDPDHPSFIQFQLANAFNQTIDTEFYETPTDRATYPAGALTPGIYIGRVAFLNGDTRQSQLTSLMAGSFSMTEFIISAVDGPPVITSPTEITVNVGQLFAYTIEATNTPGDFVVTGSPAGVRYDAASGWIGGRPTTAAKYQVGMSASNSIGTATATLTINVVQPAPLAITSSTRVAGGLGDPFRFQVLAAGATRAARLTTSALPAGLRASATSGEITGTPTDAGEYKVNVRVTDGSATADGVLFIRVAKDPAFPVIKSATSVSLAPGQPFTYKIDGAPESVDPSSGFGTNAADDTRYHIAGDLPVGLSFDPKTGVISGTFKGNAQRVDGDPDKSPLSGGALVGNVQLFASNSRGTSTVPLVFFNSPTGAVNISTRMAIASGDNVLIGGFIVTGNAPKKLIVRALGPSLPVAGAVQDPVLEIHRENGSILATNDSWKTSDAQAVIDSRVPPTDDREAAIIAAFEPGRYTAVVRGKDGTTGVALVELYDLGTASIDASSDAKLANISTRGLVQTGDDVMIGGFIISQVQSKVIVRAIGPSLPLAGALQDPMLELHSANGQIVATNDDWQTNQAQQIKDTSVPPTDPHESAIVATLNPGNYSAVVRGKNKTTGVALVEVYALQ